MPTAGHVFDVTDFGAKADGLSDSTDAIRSAAQAAGAVAGILLFPPRARSYRTLPFNVSSGVTVQVDGAISALTGDAALTRWPRLPPLPSYGRDRDGARKSRYQALLMAVNAVGVIIRGAGTLDGQGPWWWGRRTRLRAGRPHLVELYNCSRVEVSGLTLKDSPFWTLHPVYSDHVHIHHVRIRAPLYAPNADGIDPDSCRHVLIEDCDITCGDDHVAIKSGLSALARASFPKYITHNVTVRRNVLRAGMGITIGSETSGGVRDVLVHDNVIHGEGWSVALHVKTAPSRGNIVENIVFRNNVVFNTTGFMRLETAYQMADPTSLPPLAYAPTRVSNLSWINNSYGPVDRRTRSKWFCQSHTPCTAISVVNNSMPDHGKWQCSHVASFKVSGNSPGSLERCMRDSQTRARRRKRRKGAVKWRKFRWAGETDGQPSAQFVTQETEH